jgi:8-amino-7-oxononanoate synthase
VEWIEEFLEDRKNNNILRALRPVSFCREGKAYIKGKEYFNFSSNDYLGLAGHPELLEASKKAAEEFGNSSSASRLMSGDLEIYHRLEEETARFKGKQSALLFNSGYQANIGIISSLVNKEDVIFSDRLNHASIVDGILLSGAKYFRFRHNDAGHLETLLKKERGKFRKALIVTETVFSMDGDRAPLKEIADLKNKHNCLLMVDEAHATGIFGKNGSGVVEQQGLTEETDLIMGTFGKALGSFGAYAAATEGMVKYLINTCRSFIYSTALPPSVVSANLTALKLLKKEPYRREKLLENSCYFRAQLEKKGFRTVSSSQIVPLVTGENDVTLNVSRKLLERGFLAVAVRPPTVPDKQARLRFSLSFDHSRECLEKLIENIYELFKV